MTQGRSVRKMDLEGGWCALERSLSAGRVTVVHACMTTQLLPGTLNIES